MKRIITPLLLLIGMSTFSVAQTIPNASFEDWEFNFVVDTDSLLRWRAEYDYFNEDQPVVKSDDAFEGDASVLVQCPTFGDSGVYTVIPFADLSEDALIGHYKAELDDGDSASVVVQYFRGVNNIRTEASFIIKENTTEWTFFQLVLNKAESADSIRVAIYPSLDEGKQSKSKVWIDDISFGMYVGAREVAKSEFAVYPNPAVNQLFVEVKKPNSTIELLTASGKTVATFNNVSVNNRFAINTSVYEQGLYLVRVQNENGSQIKTITLK